MPFRPPTSVDYLHTPLVPQSFGGQAESLVPANWKYLDETIPSDHNDIIWYDPKNPAARIEFTGTGCTVCVEKNIDATNPVRDVVKGLPFDTTSYDVYNHGLDAGFRETDANGYAVNGVVALIGADADPNGYALYRVSLPADDTPLATRILNSFTPAPIAAATSQFLPATYRVTSMTPVDLDGSAMPQVVVTAVGTVADGGSSGLAPSTVLLLTFDSQANRWTKTFDASQEQSYQASTQQGAGPGLVDPTGAGPQVELIHDHPAGGADLLYWLNSVGGNSGNLIVGIVHFATGVATLVYSEDGDEGHVGSFDVPISTTAGVRVIGSGPRQTVQIALPWLTAADSRSQATRMYTRTLAPNRTGYQVVADDRPYVGVAIAPLVGGTEARVESVDPKSPASGELEVGDILTGVVGTALSNNITSALIGPPVIDEVAILRPGAAVTLRIVRNGQSSDVTLRLAHWSSASDALAKIGPTAL